MIRQEIVKIYNMSQCHKSNRLQSFISSLHKYCSVFTCRLQQKLFLVSMSSLEKGYTLLNVCLLMIL